MTQLRVFTFTHGNGHFAYIPAKNKVYRIPPEQIGKIPAVVEEDSSAAKVAHSQEKTAPQHTKATLIVTNRCNLKCAYCYEGGGEMPEEKTMEPKLANSAVDLIIGNAIRTNRKTVSIAFFGGEPTQALETVTAVTRYFRKCVEEAHLRGRLGITTNGVMPMVTAAWLAENLDTINLSLDGPKDIHDMHRYDSFDTAVATARTVYSAHSKKVSFRATISAYSVDRMADIVRFFGQTFPGCRVTIEPLFTLGRGAKGLCGMPDPKLFFDRLLEGIAVAKQFGCRIRNSVLRFGDSQGNFCGASGGGMILLPSGEITSCNRMAYCHEACRERFVYGRADANGVLVIDGEKLRRLQALSVNSIAACDNCFARNSCRGDCPGNKAVLNPASFDTSPSFRCEQIREFVAQVLSSFADETQ